MGRRRTTLDFTNNMAGGDPRKGGVSGAPRLTDAYLVGVEG